jgi:carboxymethylenebutenolidase
MSASNEPGGGISTGRVDIARGFEAYHARPDRAGATPGVVVFMEAFGLNGFVEGACDRLARQGYTALAPDFFHGERFDYGDRERAMAKVNALVDETVMEEMGRAMEWLRARGDVRGDRLAAIGFCMGGRLAFLANIVHGARLRATVSFYGGGIAPVEPKGRRKPLLERVPDVAAPALLIYGAKDTSITGEEHGRLAKALTEANKRYTLAVIPDAPHAFATVDRDSYRAGAAENAWRMTVEFLAAELAA